MSEDFQVEDEAEKLAESPSEAVMEFFSEHDAISREDLIELLIEKCDLSRDEAEKIFEDLVEKKRLRYSKAKGGYVWSHTQSRMRMPRSFSKTPPHRLAKGRIDSVLRLPPDPHAMPCKSYFLAKDNPAQAYYHPAMDQDKLGYLRAKQRMGAGADWPA